MFPVSKSQLNRVKSRLQDGSVFILPVPRIIIIHLSGHSQVNNKPPSRNGTGVKIILTLGSKAFSPHNSIIMQTFTPVLGNVIDNPVIESVQLSDRNNALYATPKVF